MSSVARKWLDRQRIEGATANLVLRVLADAADKTGRVKLSQPSIAARSGFQVRAVRNAVCKLEQLGAISRTKRSAGDRNGRISDLIMIAINRDFGPDDVGATGTECLEKGWAQPAPNGDFEDGRNRHEMPVTKSAPTASRVLYIKHTDLYGRIYKYSGRIWPERKRYKWRASITVNRVTFDVGRYDTDIEATGALCAALADVDYSLCHKFGNTPRPNLSPVRTDLDIATMSDALPGKFSSAWQKRYSHGCAI